MYNGHLSFEELEQLSQHKGPAENQGHIANCRQCHVLLEKYQAVSAKLDQIASVRIGAKNGMNCPDERIWFDVAAGTLASEESLKYVQHAAECSSCAQRLRAAARIFQEELTPEEENQIAALPSAAAKGQKKLAERLTGANQVESNFRKIENKGRWSSWRLFSYSLGTIATALLIAAAVIKVRQDRELAEVRRLVDSAYSSWRPTEYRIAGVPYGPARNQLGAIDRRYVNLENKVKDPQLAGTAALLRLDSKSAIKIFERARASGDASANLSNNLVVAYAIQADQTGSEEYLRTALQLANDIIDKHSNDPIAYFNRALIYRSLNCDTCLEKSRADFQRVVALDRDPYWVREAQNKLH